MQYNKPMVTINPWSVPIQQTLVLWFASTFVIIRSYKEKLIYNVKMPLFTCLFFSFFHLWFSKGVCHSYYLSVYMLQSIRNEHISRLLTLVCTCSESSMQKPTQTWSQRREARMEIKTRRKRRKRKLWNRPPISTRNQGWVVCWGIVIRKWHWWPSCAEMFI